MTVRFLDEESVSTSAKKGRVRFLDEATPANPGVMPLALFGPMGRGVSAVKSGARAEDLPGLVASAASGYYGDAPERAAERPLSVSRAGLFGVAPGVPEEKIQAPFPRPVTESGKQLGNELKFFGAAANLGNLATDIPNLIKSVPRAVKRFGDLRKQAKTGQNLSEELLNAAQTARKNVGSQYEDYINKFGDQPIDEVAVTELLKKLPKDIVEELKINPKIERATDAMGRVILKPTLRNAKAIRDIVRGDVSSKFWNPKLVDDPTKKAADFVYDEIGNVMRSGRSDLAEIMKNYSIARSAGKELYPALKTPSGFTKTKPVMKMFEKGAEGSRQQAVEALSQFNPQIVETVEKIRRFGEGAKRADRLKKTAAYLFGGGATASGGAIGWNATKKLFGG